MQGHAYLRTHDLSAEHLLIDLGESVTELHGSGTGDQSRRAITLVKQDGLNVVLAHVHKGGELAEHSAPGAATVQVLDGHITVQVGDDTLDVPAGRLVAFDAKVRHHVAALEDSTLLLTLTEPQA